jgi:hypothetical protein
VRGLRLDEKPAELATAGGGLVKAIALRIRLVRQTKFATTIRLGLRTPTIRRMRPAPLWGRASTSVYFGRSKRWIASPKAVEILGHLNALLEHPRTTRMPSLAVYGDSGTGKSMLVEKFKDDYVRNADDRPNGPKTKLLVVELACRPNERRLHTQILAVISARRRTHARQSSSWSGRQSAFLATSRASLGPGRDP